MKCLCPHSVLIEQDDAFSEKLRVQEIARSAYEQMKLRASIKRALRHRARPTRGPFSIGDTVWFWRRHKKGSAVKQGTGLTKYGMWKGKALIVAVNKNVLYLEYMGRLIRAPPEFVRHSAEGGEIPWRTVQKHMASFSDRLDSSEEIDVEDLSGEVQMEDADDNGDVGPPVGPEPNLADAADAPPTPDALGGMEIDEFFDASSEPPRLDGENDYGRLEHTAMFGRHRYQRIRPQRRAKLQKSASVLLASAKRRVEVKWRDLSVEEKKLMREAINKQWASLCETGAVVLIPIDQQS